MIKKFLKRNNGISLMDVALAIMLFVVFAGLIGNLYYQIAFNNLRVRYEGYAAYNVVRLAEYIDLMEYDEVVSKDKNALRAMRYSQEELQTLYSVEELQALSANISKVQNLLDFPEAFIQNETTDISMDVKSYPQIKQDNNLEDIVKKITITVKYEIMGKEYEYTVQKLKFKEAHG